MSVRTPPKATPGAVIVAFLIALALIGLAVVAVHDLATSQHWVSGSPWLTALAGSVDGQQPSTGLLILAVAVGLIGLALVWWSIKPARRTHVRASVDDDLWLTRSAVSALAQNVADRIPGVISADATRSRGRRVHLQVLTTADASEVDQRVHAALNEQVEGLTDSTITVHTTEVPR